MKLLLPLIMVLLCCGVSHGQGKARSAFGLHNQFVQNRAIKGYKTNAAFRWKAQNNPGLVGVKRSSGYWQDGRYYFYQQPAQRSYYQPPSPTYYQQPAQNHYYQGQYQPTQTNQSFYNSPPAIIGPIYQVPKHR